MSAGQQNCVPSTNTSSGRDQSLRPGMSGLLQGWTINQMTVNVMNKTVNVLNKTVNVVNKTINVVNKTVNIVKKECK